MKIKIKKKLDEVSSMSTGAVHGFPEKDLEEISAELRPELCRYHAGRVERAQHQGNKTITEDEDSLPSFLKKDFDLNTDDSSPEPERKTIEDIIEEELDKNGFKPVKVGKKLKFLGGGMFGGVFEAIQIDSDYLGAVKVIRATEEDIDREIRNYVKVSKARSKDPLIEKHFPETFKTWKSVDEKGDVFGFIFMEKLVPLSPEAKQHLPDRSFRRMMKGKEAEISKEFGQDISKRAEMYFKSDKFINSIKYDLDMMRSDIIFSVEKAKKDIDLESLELLDRLSNMDNSEETLSKSFQRAGSLSGEKGLSRSYETLKFLMKEFEDSTFARLVILRVFNLFAKNGEDRIVRDASIWMPLDDQINSILKSIIRETRLSTFTHGHYDKRRRLSPKQPEKQSGVEAGILALYDKTGLYARDLHEGNFLARPTGEIVIVDLGYFMMGREIKKMRDKERENRKVKESRQYRIKMLTNPKK